MFFCALVFFVFWFTYFTLATMFIIHICLLGTLNKDSVNMFYAVGCLRPDLCLTSTFLTSELLHWRVRSSVRFCKDICYKGNNLNFMLFRFFVLLICLLTPFLYLFTFHLFLSSFFFVCLNCDSFNCPWEISCPL